MTKSYFKKSIRRNAIKIRNRFAKPIMIGWLGLTLANIYVARADLLSGSPGLYSQLSLLICLAGFYILGTRTTI